MREFNFDIQNADTDFNYHPAEVKKELRELKEEISAEKTYNSK